MPLTITRGRLTPSQPKALRKFWGILTRRQRWVLSWRGWLILIALAFASAFLLFLNVQPFLSVTHRVNTDILVVEGWIPTYAIRASVEQFKAGSYQRIFVTGGPVEGNGGYINDYYTSASVGEEALKKFGLPSESLQMVPSRVIGRDRTYYSAVTFRAWLSEHKVGVHSFNVITEGAHARRTRLLYEKAFGKNVVIGIISVPNPDYDVRHWWRYSDGVREVLSEGAGYIYARLFFYPSRWLAEKKPVSRCKLSRTGLMLLL